MKIFIINWNYTNSLFFFWKQYSSIALGFIVLSSNNRVQGNDVKTLNLTFNIAAKCTTLWNYG